MRQVVLDAGPLIGLFYLKDNYHQQCVKGFSQLTQAKAMLLTPMPIVFEVYKWLLQRTRPEVAQRALQTMNDSLYVLALDLEAFVALQNVICQATRLARLSRRCDCHGKRS